MMRGSLLILALLGTSVLARAQRDPTQPPGVPAMDAAGGAASQSPWGAGGANVVVRDGKSYLVVGTRLAAVGQRIGTAKLERITETEIWLRDGGVLQKLPRFAGVQRHNSAPQTCAVPPARSAGAKPKSGTATKSPVVACEGAQP